MTPVPHPPCEPFVDSVDCPEWAELDAAAQQEIARVASQILWHRSGRQVGVCTSMAWPCLDSCGCTGCQRLDNGDMVPMSLDGQDCTTSCGSEHSCGCIPLAELELAGPYPILGITSVSVGGVPLPVESYRVDDWRLLVRLDGARWPTCNDISTPDAGLSIEFRWGNEPDELDKMAARFLMAELAKQRVCPDECALPPGLVSATSQGMTLEMSGSDIEKLRNGWDLFTLPVLSQWLAIRNPHQVATSARVHGRHARPRQRYVGTAP